MRVIFKRSYNQDIRLARHSGHLLWYGLLIALALAAPLLLDGFYVGEVTRVLIYALAGLGLMVLTGFSGQVSLGHAAFLAIGAYTNSVLLAMGYSSFIAIPAAALLSMLAGMIVALPASRMAGPYLAIATLAFAILVEDIIVKSDSLTGGNRGMAVEPPTFFGYQMWEPWQLYYLSLALLLFGILAVLNILRSPAGRAMIAIRDSEVSARSLGIHVVRTKLYAFAVSAALTGLAGALFAHYLQYLAPETFAILLSILILLMIVVGGLGTAHGAVLGAIVIGLLETGISIGKDWLPAAVGTLPGLEPLLFGLILVGFILFEPQGVYGRWVKIRTFFEYFPVYRKKAFKRQRVYLKTERMH